MDLPSLGAKIKAERRRQGLTLEVLSEQVGISRNFLWEIEAGRKAPALNTLYNLGVTLNISIDYLMGASSEKRAMTSEPHITERDLEISRIVKELNGYGMRELLLVSDLISGVSQYLKQK